MLAWRATSRSFLRCHLHRILPKPTSQFRALSVYPDYPQFRASPTTLSARLWHRRDGTPRSKVKGLIIGGTVSATLFTMYVMLSLLIDFDNTNRLLSLLIHIQRVDNEFSSVQVSEFTPLHQYFQDLCRELFRDNISQHLVDTFFSEVESLTGPTKDEAHKALQDTCEEIHQILLDSKGQAPPDTAAQVMASLDKGLHQLVEMVQDRYIGEFREMLRDQNLSAHVKDAATKHGEYEVVG